jgi:signal transduction histidine kinase/ActR/RegA family two-component response regulator
VHGEADPIEDRVLVFALHGGDMAFTERILQSDGVTTTAVEAFDDLLRLLAEGAGAVVLTEETLRPDTAARLLDVLNAQPAWSSLPLIVSTTDRGALSDNFPLWSSLGARASLTLLDRPVRVRTLLMAVRGALRARRRQYQTRGLLRQLEASEAREKSARERAEASNRSKDEFLATVSHELRTPLNAMLGWARMLNAGQLNEAQTQRALDAIERNAVAQAHLIEDLLDVSRIISGKLRLNLSEVDLETVIESAIESVRPAIDAKQLQFELTVDVVNARILGDPNRLQQVVWNLLSNAIKFTPRRGQIRLSASRVDSHVEVAVTDSGQGIDPAFGPYMFQRFTQEDGSPTRAQGGLGLGLSISRHLVELHGGTIEAHSEGPGRGATFCFKLPVTSVRRVALDGARGTSSLKRDLTLDKPPELQGLKVLVVDDEADARELVIAVLSQCGSTPVAAGSVQEALVAVASEHPDVIVSDIGMPVENGYELIRRVRALSPQQGGCIPAAALTAYARAEDRRQAMKAGFELHLSKPIEPAELISAVATLARIGNAMK